MGTTSEKLTYLNTTKGQIKDSINLTGANILSTDTFRSYANSLKNAYVDIINNGTDTLYSNFPKVTGTGTSVTLNNTYEAPMKLDYYGDTQQDSYSGKNLFNINGDFSFGGYSDIPTINSDGTLTTSANFNVARSAGQLISNLKANTTYTISATLVSTTSTGTSKAVIEILKGVRGNITRLGIQYFSSLSNQYFTFTTPSDTTDIWISISSNGTNTSSTFGNIQIEEGSFQTNFEPYVGGIASPNPDYPQSINVVTGSQSVSVTGKNLFSSEMEQGVLDSSTGQTASSTTRLRTKDYITVKPNTTYTLSIAESNMQVFVYNYKNDGTYINRTPSNWQNLSYTFTTGNNVEKIKFIIQKVGSATIVPSEISNIQIELGSPATTYEPYSNTTYTIDLGTTELCKINDYEDSIQKSTGKNLFNKNDVTLNYRIDSSGNEYSDNNCFVSGYIPIDANTSYTFNLEASIWECMSFYTSDKTFISRITTNNSYTSPNNASYLRICAYKINIDILQLEENSTSTEYEPYGKVWYKKANIGKVVLDGSETYSTGTQSGYYYFYKARPTNSSPSKTCLSNYFNYNQSYTNYDNSIYIGNTNVIISRIKVNNSYIESDSDFQTWLNTHNTTIYYPLATPTYTNITDSTLISQLEAIKKSYEDKTYINVSGSLPVILNASALSKE